MSTTIFLLVLTGGFLHAAWNFAAKKIGGNIVVLWFGFSIVTLLAIPGALYTLDFQTIPREIFWYILFSGLLTAVYFWGLSKAYEQGEISFCYPIIRGIGIGGTALFAPLVLGQHPSMLGILGILLICGGIFLISLRRKHEFQVSDGLQYALLTGSAIVGYSLLDSVAVQMVSPLFYELGYHFAAMLFLAPYVLTFHRREIATAWKKWKWQGIGIGLVSMSVYLIILCAFRSGVTSYVVALRDTSIGFGALLGFLFLQEKFTWRKGLGILVILLGAVLIKFA